MRASPTLAALSTRTLVLYLVANAWVLVAIYAVRMDQVLSAVLDIDAPDVAAMRVATLAFVVYGAALISLLLLAVHIVLRALTEGLAAAVGRSGPPDPSRILTLPVVVVLLLAVALPVMAFVDTTVFKDYGIHFYEYDVASVFFDAASARDLGIRPPDVAFALGAAGVLVGLQLALFLGLGRLARSVPEAWGGAAVGALVLMTGFGYLTFASSQSAVRTDRHEFLATLPMRGAILLQPSARPHIAVQPRTGPLGYPRVEEGDAPPGADGSPGAAPGASTPRIDDPKNVVVFLGDGFRADHVSDSAGLTPSLMAFGARPEVIVPERHYATSHATETGLYGLVYGLEAFTYHPFLEHRIPPWPLEVLKANGYVTALFAGTRIIQYPSSAMLDAFDHVVYPPDDDALLEAFDDFVTEREADGKPYVAFAFFYTPHYPYDSVEPGNERFLPAVEEESRSPFDSFDDPDFRTRARNSYRNAVIQADDYFRRVFERVRPEYEAGRTALIATSDHGTEMWEHGLFGHGRSTFWEEKVRVPMFLGLPGARLVDGATDTPPVASHPDVWPTLFEYLGADPMPEVDAWSHGVSLLSTSPRRLARRDDVTLAGRYFPWANRMNALVGRDAKYWFTVGGLRRNGRLEVEITRLTDLEDVAIDTRRAGRRAMNDAPRLIDAFEREFWRFLEPVDGWSVSTDPSLRSAGFPGLPRRAPPP